MSNNKKRKNKNIKHNKKVLDGVNLVKKEKIDLVKKNDNIKKDDETKNKTVNDIIQNTVSILFTIVIFILILVLIFVLYNKFLKKEEINKEEVCSEYIKKDINIKEEDIINYIIGNRYIIYNINEFDSSKIDSKTINEFAKYIIWNSDSEYSVCQDNDYCLDTKKEIDYDSLKEQLEYFFNLNSFNFVFNYEFKDDDVTRLFVSNNKVILTFKNMEYETFKHEIVDTRIDENNIYIIFALAKRVENDVYSYSGYKKLHMVLENNNIIIKDIKTYLNS